MIVFTLLPLVFCLWKASTLAIPPRQSLPPFITLEEHFTTAEIAAQYTSQAPWIIQKLEDLDGLRLAEMDQGQIIKQ